MKFRALLLASIMGLLSLSVAVAQDDKQQNQSSSQTQAQQPASDQSQPVAQDQNAADQSDQDQAKDTKDKDKDKKDKTEQRVFVVGDSDFLTDVAVRFGGNGLLVLDPVRWLMGEESFAGQISTEADVPITHTRKQDVAWFYSSIFVVPGLVLGLGFVVTRRGRRSRKRAGTSSPPSPSSSSGAAAAAANSQGAAS